MSRLQAKAGAIAFTGSYRWEKDSERPGKFDLKAEEADASELARLFAPALLRERGFLARTLRLGANAPIPAWLKELRAEGAVTIGMLTAGDIRLRGITALLKWDGPMVHLRELSGSVEPAEFAGDLSIDLRAGTPEPAAFYTDVRWTRPAEVALSTLAKRVLAVAPTLPLAG